MAITTLVIKQQSQLHVWNPITLVRIQTNFGVIVEYDGNMWTSVLIPLAYRNCVVGMCGNADGIKNNDLRTRQGEDVSGPLMFWKIGNSWEVKADMEEVETGTAMPTTNVWRDATATNDNELPVSGDGMETDIVWPTTDLWRDTTTSPDDGVTDGYAFPSCDADTAKAVDSDAYCGSLKNDTGPLTECMAKMPELAQAFFEGCKYDACANKIFLTNESPTNTLALFFIPSVTASE
ncbi:hypothetical protein LSAT2_014298 [Lamellibrachia satsuma]|nr:hypothetical protein LSAT2_014298 [Lamellibrachia satsuma]